MTTNARSLEERLRAAADWQRIGCFDAELMKESADALAAKDKLLAGAMKVLEPYAMLGWQGERARTTLANLKAEMEGK